LSSYGGFVLLAAAVAALAMSPAAAAGCAPPSGAKILAESRRVAVWRSGRRITGCAKASGRRRHLFDLDPKLHERTTFFLPGERVVAAIVADGFSEMALYRFTGRREPVFLSAGFARVTELVRSREGHFAWVELQGGETACPCTVRAGDSHETFVVARRSRSPSDVRIEGARVSFDNGANRERVRVPFVTPHAIDARPDPGGAHSQFKLAVTLPHGLPADGRTRADVTDQTSTGDDCNGMTVHAPRQHVTRDGRKRRITLTTRDARWCVGTYRGLVTYEWGRHSGFCGPVKPNCSGSVIFGRFTLRVTNPNR
jgi:hypothetical protein